MHHKIKNIIPTDDYKLVVQFSEGATKIYDIKWLYEKYPVFKKLEDLSLFKKVSIEPGGYGLIWNEELDLDSEELWENGERTSSPFDGLISFGDAAEMWGLNESTLRKAVKYGKLVNGRDVCKYGKQWVITIDAMNREYGKRRV